ncbi:MAG: hypothetical protein ABI847_10080 [Anaerolineales bacterium]
MTRRVTPKRNRANSKSALKVTAQAAPSVQTSPPAAACPLAAGWPARLRPLHFQFSSSDQEAFLRASHASNLGARLSVIEAQWVAADDDRSNAPFSEEDHLFADFPCHIHTEFVVDGQRVHIDRTWANLWGPGRLKEEWHVHIDGVLAGFGGQIGCSLGFTRAIGPAVALLNDGRAVVVYRHPWRGIKLQDVLLEPDEIVLHTVKPSMQQTEI